MMSTRLSSGCLAAVATFAAVVFTACGSTPDKHAVSPAGGADDGASGGAVSTSGGADDGASGASGGVVASAGAESGGEAAGGAVGTSGCATPTGPGVEHVDYVTTDETWTAADSPHLIPRGIRVQAGATLTIEPCAEVRIQEPAAIRVFGALVALGASDQHIKIHADDPAKPFGYIGSSGGSISLAYVDLENGGSTQDPNGNGVLDVSSDQNAPTEAMLSVQHVTITGSQQYGISLSGGATFTADSTDLTIADTTDGPLRVPPRLLSNIPDGDYTSNKVAAITVPTLSHGDIAYGDVTIAPRGVPYLVVAGSGNVADFRVGGGEIFSTLTILPGVELRFTHDGVFWVEFSGGSSGALIALGTDKDKILLTSSAWPVASPGDWLGLKFGGTEPSPTNQLEKVVIDNAGGGTLAAASHCLPTGEVSRDEDAAVTLFAQPSGVFIADCQIQNSAALGIDEAWRGDQLDFVSGNRFEAVADCKQSRPRDVNGGCMPSLCP